MRRGVAICLQYDQPGSTQKSYEGSGKVWTTFRGTSLILADYVVGGRMDDFQIKQVFLGVQNVFVYSDGAGRRFNHLVVGPD